jgi:hypothetical protein
MSMAIRKCTGWSGDSGAIAAESGIGLDHDDEEELDLMYDYDHDSSEDEEWSSGKSKRLELKKIPRLRVV